MSNITLNLDAKALNTIDDLQAYYGCSSRAEVFRKAITLLKIAAEIEEQQGYLLAKKDAKDGQEGKETRILVS